MAFTQKEIDAKKIAVELFELQQEEEKRKIDETQNFECPLGLEKEAILSKEDSQTLKDFCSDLREYKKIKRNLVIKIIIYGAIGTFLLMLGDKGTAIIKLLGIDKIFS